MRAPADGPRRPHQGHHLRTAGNLTRVTGATEGSVPANGSGPAHRRRSDVIAPDLIATDRADPDVGDPTDAEADVLGSWTATVIHALDQCGVDGTALAIEAGIDVEGLDDPDRRVPLTKSTRLWHLAAEATGDPCVGLQVARHVRPGTFHGLSVGVVSSPSFRDALERMVRFGRVVLNPTGHADLTEVDGTPAVDPLVGAGHHPAQPRVDGGDPGQHGPGRPVPHGPRPAPRRGRAHPAGASRGQPLRALLRLPRPLRLGPLPAGVPRRAGGPGPAHRLR